ncbi:MAG: hypothetical protein MJY78_10945 [Fibrobacter sp.]|nr:hypothetical protein [Fibrobacter sp.]
MSSVFFWLLIVVCVVALVLLFFPLKVRITFEVGERGGQAHFFFFKKNFWNYEKKWGKDNSEFKIQNSQLGLGGGGNSEFKIQNSQLGSDGESNAEFKIQNSKLKSDENIDSGEEKTCKSEKMEGEKEKRSLTDKEFWTLLLTPDLDARGLRYAKAVLVALFKFLKVKFVDCYVEGIRMDYETMGYGAAVNGVMKGFPYLEDWDIRMDWCNEKELHSAGTILLPTNLCRTLGFLLCAAYYCGILAFIFWRRRAAVLKTGELPKLGFVRRKIVDWMAED